MTNLREIEFRPVAVTSAVVLWLMFMVVVAGTAVLVLGLPGGKPESNEGVARAGSRGATTVVGEATLPEAAALLRGGRHAEAYGRFVVLADAGDVEASRIALHLYHFGPSVYGSQWDASAEQLWRWTRASQKAEDLEFAQSARSGRPRP